MSIPPDADTDAADASDLTCATCSFYAQRREAEHGECRTSPPSLALVRPWPTVRSSDWCAQHVSRELGREPEFPRYMPDDTPVDRAALRAALALPAGLAPNGWCDRCDQPLHMHASLGCAYCPACDLPAEPAARSGGGGPGSRGPATAPGPHGWCPRCSRPLRRDLPSQQRFCPACDLDRELPEAEALEKWRRKLADEAP